MLARGSRAGALADEDRSHLEPISVRIPDVMRMTGLGRSTVYELIAAGDIEAAKVGRSTVVFVDSVRRFLSANRKQRRDQQVGHLATTARDE